MQPNSMWRIKDDRWVLLDRPLIMGVVNCTPDSFYDGGQHEDPEAAFRHGLILASQGAGILDVGGESTRPGSRPVGLEEEAGRVLPVIRGLRDALAKPGVIAASGTGGAERTGSFVVEGRAVCASSPDSATHCRAIAGAAAVISIDTTKAAVAAAALEAGADIVNDVSACRFEPGLLDVLQQFQPGYVLMHAQGRPETMQVQPVYDDVVDDVCRFLEDRMNVLVRSGLPETTIVLDPGIGFGKRLEHNLELLGNMHRLIRIGRPVLVGLSNKSFWKGLLGLALGERGTATQVATALLAAKGVGIHRVHDVAATFQTLQIVQALVGQGRGDC